MSTFHPRPLGDTGLKVGRLGVAGGYGAPAAAFEMAFERGCNYFYWSSPRKPGMGEAIRNLCRAGKRDDLVIVLQSYSRSPLLLELFFRRGLKAMGQDSGDVLLLGYHNRPPSSRLLDRALKMQQQGMFRFLALSGHNRRLFPQLAAEGYYDLFHFRYNAAHRDAETDILTKLDQPYRPGTVSYTATCWGQLLDPKAMPANESPLAASDCYRFVMSNPLVDVCLCGPKDISQMQEALTSLDKGELSEQELGRIRRIGDHVHRHGRKFW